MDVQVHVVGLADLNRSLRKIDKDAPKQLRIALNSAAELLADRVRPQIPTDSGAARRSLKVASTRTAARIAVGGKRAAYYPWLDFGGQGRKRGRPGKREFIREGRYIYPTLARIRPDIEKQLQEALDDVVTAAGLDL